MKVVDFVLKPFCAKGVIEEVGKYIPAYNKYLNIFMEELSYVIPNKFLVLMTTISYCVQNTFANVSNVIQVKLTCK